MGGRAMTVVRSLAIFRADFPDDSVWSEDEEEIVHMGGKAIAETVVSLLKGFGYDVGDPELEDEHGWQFHASTARRNLFLQVTDLGGEIYLTCRDTSLINQLLKRHHPAYLEFLSRLHEALSRDGRFHDILWHDPMGWDKRATPHPISEA
jgi:hypothetical protein